MTPDLEEANFDAEIPTAVPPIAWPQSRLTVKIFSSLKYRASQSPATVQKRDRALVEA
jgi:hypothetical protein